MADNIAGQLLGEDQRSSWCGDGDVTGRFVCRRIRDHALDWHAGRNAAGGIHQWKARGVDGGHGNMPAAIPATAAPENPADCPVGTVLVDPDTGRWAVRFDRGDDTGKGQHVWLAPAGVLAADARFLHHVEVRGWHVGEARRWRLADDAPAVDRDMRRRAISALTELVSEFISPDEFGGYDVHYGELVDIVLDVVRPELDRLRARIHEAVDETQRRYAPFQKRCARFDQWSTWARERFEASGDKSWFFSSEAVRLLVLSFIQDKEAAEAELADMRASREAWAIEADRLDHLTHEWMREGGRAVLKRKAMSAALRKMARDLDSLPSRYTVGPSNALRVVGLLLEDISKTSAVLREAAETADQGQLASRPAIPADASAGPGDTAIVTHSQLVAGMIVGLCGQEGAIPSQEDLDRTADLIMRLLDAVKPAPVSGSDTTASGCPACATGGEHTFGGIEQFHADGAAVLGEAAEAANAAGSDTTADGAGR